MLEKTHGIPVSLIRLSIIPTERASDMPLELVGALSKHTTSL